MQLKVGDKVALDIVEFFGTTTFSKGSPLFTESVIDAFKEGVKTLNGVVTELDEYSGDDFPLFVQFRELDNDAYWITEEGVEYLGGSETVTLDLKVLLQENHSLTSIISSLFRNDIEKLYEQGYREIKVQLLNGDISKSSYCEILVSREDFDVKTQYVQRCALKRSSLEDNTIVELIRLVNQWGVDRNITKEGGVSALKQVSKLLEEAGETVSALADESEGIDATNDLRDAYGDMLVCIIQAVRLSGMTIQECLSAAYEEIKDRKGTMVNGKFVKE